MICTNVCDINLSSMKNNSDNSSVAQEISSIEGEVGNDTWDSPDGKRISGIRQTVSEEVAIPCPVVIIPPIDKIPVVKDPVEEHHDRLVAEFPEGYRRIAFIGDVPVPMPSRKEQDEQRRRRNAATHRLPPLSTLSDDDDTPRMRK